MRVKREELLKKLEMVKAGLSAREFIEQSNCFVFQDGKVMTFNDHIACRIRLDLGVTGAVQANSLLNILARLEDEELSVQESEEGELVFRGKRKEFGVTKDAGVHLPIDRVEVPEKWRTMSEEFVPALSLAQHCVSSDESRFRLTCIHIHPEYIEACDNFQAIRCRLNTGIKNEVLIPGTSIMHVLTLGVHKIAFTKSWVHFRNNAGLIFSCRRYNEDYPDLATVLDMKGSPLEIPKGLMGASERAAVFAEDKDGTPSVIVTISDGKIRVRGEGLSGWYNEVKSTSYKGVAIAFLIKPDLLRYIADKYRNASITEGRLKVVGDSEGNWQYVAFFGTPEEAHEQRLKKKRKKKEERD